MLMIFACRLSKLSENGGFPQLWKRWQATSPRTVCRPTLKAEPFGFDNLLFAFFALGSAYVGAFIIMGIELIMKSFSTRQFSTTNSTRQLNLDGSTAK